MKKKPNSTSISASKRDPTEFERRVYSICKEIPKGHFSTYSQLAKGLKSSPRAVGQALKRNPFAPHVPCHRVLASNFSLGGYYGVLNNPKKITLLREEGILLDENGYIVEKDRSKIIEFGNK